MRKGFTLIELVLVIAILAILAGAMVPIITANREEARVAKANSELDAIKSAALMYHADTGAWPAAIGNLTVDPGVAGWGGPYLDQVGRDPWGNTYSLDINGTQLSAQAWAVNDADNNCGGDDLCLIITPNNT